MIPSSPADDQRWIAFGLAMRETDPAFLGHVQLATKSPVVRLLEIGRCVLRGHFDFTNIFACVFLSLEFPRFLPHLPLAEARRLVSSDRQKWDGFGLGEFSGEYGYIEVFPAPVDGGDLKEILIPTRLIGQLGDGLEPWLVMLWCRPVNLTFQTVKEPVSYGTLLLLVPRFIIPPTLELWLFDQSDVLIGLDDVDPTFYHLSIAFRPVGRNLCGWLRPVALEPRCLQFSFCHLASHHNLKSSPSEFKSR